MEIGAMEIGDVSWPTRPPEPSQKTLEVCLPGFQFNVNLTEIPAVWDIIKSSGIVLNFVCGPLSIRIA